RDFWSIERAKARKAGDSDREAEAIKRFNAANSGPERKRIENDYQRKLGDVDDEAKKLGDRRAAMVEASEVAVGPRLEQLAKAEQVTNAEYGRKRDEIRAQLDNLHKGESDGLRQVHARTKERDALAAQIKVKEG